MKKLCDCTKDGGTQLEEVTSFLKVIAEPHRLHILCLLKDGAHCVCDIWQHLGLPQNLVSHHLKELKNFGLITSRKEGLKVIYSLNDRSMKNYAKLLSHFLSLP
ncbi:MAG: metalloregulator ArsR/SmtB family transcription factor [Candidatus Peribacteraceae bacterium]|nr:metalloregulator ArsR/SmtB family transcription factor [Candidatus Peribacteraceae bacterium]